MTSVEIQEISSDQLARQFQAGCGSSFEQLVKHHASRILNYLCQIVGNRADAEDLTQITFLKVYQSIQRFDPNRSFDSWLFAIAKHTAFSHVRRARSFVELPEEMPADEADPAATLTAKDDHESLWNRARSLPPRQFEALWLRYNEGFSVAEIARIMSLTAIHVKVLLHRGRSHLAKQLLSRPTHSPHNQSAL